MMRPITAIAFSLPFFFVRAMMDMITPARPVNTLMIFKNITQDIGSVYNPNMNPAIAKPLDFLAGAADASTGCA